MGRGKSERKKKAPALTTTRRELVVEPQIETSSSITDVVEGPGVSKTRSKKKIIKLVDVVSSSVLRISNGQTVSIIDSDVHANGVLIGRVPKQEDIIVGTGRIHRIDTETSEVWIKI